MEHLDQPKAYFQSQVYGKWILAGEHSVLRGAPALVFPVYGKSFKILAEKNSENLQVEFKGSRGQEVQVLFSGIFDKALKQLGRERSELKDRLVIDNEIPVGAGMGASAALCVAISRYLVANDFLKEDEIYDFARGLEDTFHGESSGVDIAVALSGSGLVFTRDGERNELLPKWRPKWYLSYSGKRGLTSECVERVKKLIAENPRRGELIDQRMRDSVTLAKDALLQKTERGGFPLLKEAIELAHSCFYEWGLCNESVLEHMRRLNSFGARACKLTGSGDGGFVLSLWSTPPPRSITSELINLNP